jgi:hypothetical protein
MRIITEQLRNGRQEGKVHTNTLKTTPDMLLNCEQFYKDN